ncbi:hypothetical protein F511_13331 [Dorcoceras hygrometricum]|uniref:Uncharacterized protein n=1 Tax=Dorcoceras hygrometricum TaxID=472368 RepID=A0A2Z7C5X8_9LAMI|nr:hypothetical protein F511_13331 [Dorcoceras hygrometricum]
MVSSRSLARPGWGVRALWSWDLRELSTDSIVLVITLYRPLTSNQRRGCVITRIVVFSENTNPTSIQSSTCLPINGWKATSRGSCFSSEVDFSSGPDLSCIQSYTPILRLGLTTGILLMPPVPPRDPRTEQNAPDPEDLCSDREVAQGLVLQIRSVSRGLMTSRILPGYFFPYLNDMIIEDHGEDLASKIAESISPEIPDVGEYSSGYAHLTS